MFKQLSQWLIYLEQLQPNKIELGLERVLNVALLLKILPFNKKVVTISGTNGKGSCVVLLEKILLESGYTVGSYISPHLIDFNERIRINGQPISDQDLCQAFEKVAQAKQDIPLTYFEFTTLAALDYFYHHDLDLIILEVGMGGRLDAVNIIDADIAMISSIGLDHQQWLGNTREQIALEKVGIARAHKPLICGDPEPPITLIDYCEKNSVPLSRIHHDFQIIEHQETWNWHSRNQKYENLPYPKVFLNNAATVLMAIGFLNSSFSIPKQAIDIALKSAAMPGRLQQIIYQECNLLLDVSHNLDALEKLKDYLKTNFPKQKLHAIFGMLNDKDIKNSLLLMKDVFETWTLCELESSRSYKLDELKNHASSINLKNPQFASSVIEAFDTVSHRTSTNDFIVVFGSFYAVSPFLKV